MISERMVNLDLIAKSILRLVRVLDSLISVQREWFGSKYDSHGLEISIIKYLVYTCPVQLLY